VDVVSAQRRARMSYVAVAAGVVAVVTLILMVVSAQPRPDPWSGTRSSIEFMCQVPPGTPISYQGRASDRNAVRFSAPGHPFILVPYNPIGGYEHPIPGDIEC
jgi:hypothetical protein